jgi:hypothetical protein
MTEPASRPRNVLIFIHLRRKSADMMWLKTSRSNSDGLYRQPQQADCLDSKAFACWYTRDSLRLIGHEWWRLAGLLGAWNVPDRAHIRIEINHRKVQRHAERRQVPALELARSISEISLPDVAVQGLVLERAGQGVVALQLICGWHARQLLSGW